MILLIDNYDSFVYNLARYLRRLGAVTRVVRNDAVDVAVVRQMRPAAIVLSPGPCAPQQAGCSLELVRELHGELPILGICLGHQAIAEAMGGRVVRSPKPVHGRAGTIRHGGDGLLAGLPSPLTVGRYHSLCVDEATLPDCLRVAARGDDGVVMAIEHVARPVFGVQFHPESVLTAGGHRLLANFLRLAGMPTAAELPTLDDELTPVPAVCEVPGVPITF